MRAAIAVLGLCFAACAPQEAAPPADAAATSPIEDGRKLAQLNCARCHAMNTAGESRMPDAPPFRTLAERYPGSLLADAFPERMRQGHPSMPEFSFTDAEIASLLAYLQSIQERQPA